MKSLLFQDGATPFEEPESCGIGRQEVPIAIKKDGRLYRFTLRDKIAPEDPYTVMVRAAAFSIQTGEPYNGTPPNRSVKDFLIKQSVVI
jgi:hypothetical protein